MWKATVRSGVVVAIVLASCSNGSTTDAGLDAPADAPPDLCDLDSFFEAGGDGKPCPMASSRLCFEIPNCPKVSGCRCVATSNGPRWSCLKTPASCFPEAGVDATDDSSATDASANEAGD